MSAKKTGGLAFNPLLSRTEPSETAAQPIPEPQPTNVSSKPHAPTTLEPDTVHVGDVPPPAGTLTRLPVHTPDLHPVEGTTQEAAERPSKFTFYFTPEQLDRLDDAWERMRRGRRAGRRPSKSRFVRVALDRLLDEFEQNPEHVIALLREEPVG